MNYFDRYPHLMTSALGLPYWAIHLRTVNNINMIVALFLAVVVAVTQSLGAGVVYAAIFIVSRLVVAGIGGFLAQQDFMLGSMILATLVLIALNALLGMHFFGVWSPV